MGHAVRPCFSSGGCGFSVQSGFEPNKTVPNPVCASSLDQATRPRGAPHRHTIMAIATALPRLLMATAAPAMTWLPLNVVVVDNDRGDSPSAPYLARARAYLGLACSRAVVPPGTPWMDARWQPLAGTLLSQSARGGMT